MTLTEKGREALGINSGKSDRHGGPEHRYWIRRIADYLRAQGFNVAEEAPVGDGKTIDILATNGGKRIAFEIETGKSDVAANVKKCRDAQIDKIVVVTTCPQVHNKVRDRLITSTSPEVELLQAQSMLHGRAS